MAEDKYDFFDDDDDEVIIPEQEKEKEETPEEKEEKEIANDTIHRGYNRLRMTVYLIVAALVIWLCACVWLRYFHPYVSEAQQTGRMMEFKCQGAIFKTYEGKMLSEKFVDYPEKWLEYDFPFSVTNDSIARKLMRLQGTGKQMVLTYEEYQGTLPWRGDSHRIVTGYEILDE